MEGGQLDHCLHFAFKKNRENDDGGWRGGSQAGTNLNIIFGDVAHQQALSYAEMHQAGPRTRLLCAVGPLLGFIETADGREIYFHRNSVLNDAFSRLAPGTRVAFSEEMGEKGPQASSVKLLGKHGLR